MPQETFAEISKSGMMRTRRQHPQRLHGAMLTALKLCRSNLKDHFLVQFKYTNELVKGRIGSLVQCPKGVARDFPDHKGSPR
jgi:hypothetical protein